MEVFPSAIQTVYQVLKSLNPHAEVVLQFIQGTPKYVHWTNYHRYSQVLGNFKKKASTQNLNPILLLDNWEAKQHPRNSVKLVTMKRSQNLSFFCSMPGVFQLSVQNTGSTALEHHTQSGLAASAFRAYNKPKAAHTEGKRIKLRSSVQRFRKNHDKWCCSAQQINEQHCFQPIQDECCC